MCRLWREYVEHVRSGRGGVCLSADYLTKHLSKVSVVLFFVVLPSASPSIRTIVNRRNSEFGIGTSFVW